MAIKSLEVRFVGFAPLLQNNPQTVDTFNHFAKAKKKYTAKRAKTDEDVLALRVLEIESKVWWDDDLGVYVPSSWVMASIAKNAFKVAKIAKDKARGGIFAVESKAKLTYDGMSAVKKLKDISKNERFNTTLILPQQQVRLCKAFPIFHKWSFEIELEYDDKIIDKDSLLDVLNYSAKYNGFGDFRPTYGRATVEVINE